MKLSCNQICLCRNYVLFNIRIAKMKPEESKNYCNTSISVIYVHETFNSGIFDFFSKGYTIYEKPKLFQKNSNIPYNLIIPEF